MSHQSPNLHDLFVFSAQTGLHLLVVKQPNKMASWMVSTNIKIVLPFLFIALLLTMSIIHADRLESFNQGKPILIRNGLVVDEFNEHPNTDVLIVDGRILQVGQNLPMMQDVYIIDATGHIVIPGAIDPHCHISMPFMSTVTADDWQSASLAGLAGGTLTIFDFILPIDHSLTAGVEQWKKRVQEQGTLIDYSFHVAVTGIFGPKNPHPRNQTLCTLCEMYQITEDEGITSFKFFLAYKNALMIRDDDFLLGLQQCSQLGALALVHAENGDAVDKGIHDALAENCFAPKCHLRSRPSILEAEATNRAAILAQFADAALYVVHVQSKAAVEAISRVRHTYKRVVGEAVVSGFTLDERWLDTDDFDEASKYVMSPPFHLLDVDGVAIKEALAGEDSLQTIGTDHATFTKRQKRCVNELLNDCSQDKPQSFNRIPNGVNGIEERVAMTYDKLVHTKMISLSQFVRLISTNSAKLFGIYPQKGSLATGSDADVVIFDPNRKWTIDQAKQNIHPEVSNVFHGMHVQGKVLTSISRGEVLYENESFAPGVARLKSMTSSQKALFSRGKFIGREPFSSELYRDLARFKNNGEVYVDENGLLHIGKRIKHDEL